MLSSNAWRTSLALAAAWAVVRRLLYAGFVLALVALAAALAVAVAPRLFGYGTLVVHGGSMGDSTPNGSLVIARWIPDEDVEIRDVILVREESAALPKIHRVVEIHPEGGHILIRTKGDANETLDPNIYILPDRVLTPAYTLPYLGRLVGFPLTPVGWALAVMLPATLLCAATLRDIWFGKAPRREGLSAEGWPG